jgi:alpha-N-acetylglucosaminidase
MWAGLVGDLYYARWDLYLQFLEQALLEKKEFDKSRYNQKIAQVLQEWVDNMKIYPNKPTGDPIAISRLLYSKWIRI